MSPAVAFGQGTTQMLYRQRNGGTWDSSDQNMGSAIATTPRFVKCETKPLSPDIVCAVSNNNQFLDMFVWTGTSNVWASANQTTSTSKLANKDVEGFDVTFQRTNGNAIVIWGSEAPSIDFRNFSTSWSSDQTAYSSLPDKAVWLEADFSPVSTSRSIAVTWGQNNGNVEMGGFDGTSWVTRPTATAQSNKDESNMDVQYQENGTAIFVMVTSAADTQLSWRSWNGISSTFGTLTLETGTAGTLITLQLRADYRSDDMMVLYSDSNLDLFHRKWDGSTWASLTTALEVNLPAIEKKEAFMFDWRAVDPTGAAFTRTITETLTLSDSPDRIAANIRTETETLTLSDAEQRTVTNIRISPETLTLSDATTRISTIARITIETLTFSDATTSIDTITRLISESLTFSDQALRISANIRSIGETLTLSDTFNRDIARLRTIVETLTFSDTTTRLTTAIRLVTETLTFSDATTRLTIIIRVVVETLTFSDSPNTLVVITRTISESLTLADQHLRIAANIRVDVETLTFSDVTTRIVVSIRTISETLTFAESADGIKSLIRTLTESLTFSDQHLRLATNIRTDTESLTFSDINSRIVVLTRQVTETLTFSDTVSGIKSLVRLITETLTFSDSPTRVTAALRLASETLTFSDTTTRIVSNIRTVAETLTFIDTHTGEVLADIIRTIIESLTFSEQVLRQVINIRVTTETLTFSDSASGSVNIVRTIIESLTLADQTTRTTTIVRQISETLNLSEVANRMVSNIRQIAEALGFVDLFDGFEGVPAPPAAPEFGGDIFFIYERFFANEDLALVNVQLIVARLPHVVSLSDGCVVNDLRMNATLIQIDVEGSQCLLEILSRTKPLRVDLGNNLGVEESPVGDVISELNTPAWGYIQPRLHIRVPSEDHTPIRIAFDEDALLLLPIIIPLVINAGILFLGAWLLAERVFLAFDRMRSFTYTFHFPVQRHRTQRSRDKLNKARV